MRPDRHNAVAAVLEHGVRVRRARLDHPMSGNGNADTEIVAARMLAQLHVPPCSRVAPPSLA
eukprot:341944-Alexandrium_andersonii.AAC.1